MVMMLSPQNQKSVYADYTIYPLSFPEEVLHRLLFWPAGFSSAFTHLTFENREVFFKNQKRLKKPPAFTS
jgi:hypothetical protein